MRTAEVYDEISPEDLLSLARDLGLPARTSQRQSDGKTLVWLTVAGRETLLVVRSDTGRRSSRLVHFFEVLLDRTSSPARANHWNVENAFAAAWVDSDGNPSLDAMADVKGVTREHLATQLFMWEANVRSFVHHFS